MSCIDEAYVYARTRQYRLYDKRNWKSHASAATVYEDHTRTRSYILCILATPPADDFADCKRRAYCLQFVSVATGYECSSRKRSRR